ncbi:Uncharacterised protein [Klebsiella pneumoniae]|nr:Uncharacterised protein [Klebsiella pneumoniae]
MRVQPGDRQHSYNDFPAPLLHHLGAGELKILTERRFQCAEAIPQQKGHAAPGHYRQQPWGLHQQRATAKNTGADQQQVADRAQQGNHQVILTTDPLIHHKSILRAKRQNHCRSQGKALKVIGKHKDFSAVFESGAVYNANGLLAEIESINH